MNFVGEFIWIILLFCLTGFPFLMGKGLLTVLYGRKDGKIYAGDCLLIGWLIVIGLAETAHLTAVFWGRSFPDAVMVFGVGAVLFSAAAVCILLWRKDMVQDNAGSGWRARARKNAKKGPGGADWQKFPCTTMQIVMIIVFVTLAVLRMTTILNGGAVYRTGDMTVETVESFLKTDSVYQVNPLTGHAYTDGMPLRLKVLCLPTLYGSFCRIFKVSAVEMVWTVIPVTVFIGSCLAYYMLARSLFPGKDGKESRFQEKRWLFLVFVACIFLVGDYLFGMDGFGLAYSGFRGVTIRNAVLVPYTFSLVLRHKWKLAVICVLAEACIVWTLYGMGVCFLVLVGMLLIRMCQKHPGQSRFEKED